MLTFGTTFLRYEKLGGGFYAKTFSVFFSTVACLDATSGKSAGGVRTAIVNGSFFRIDLPYRNWCRCFHCILYLSILFNARQRNSSSETPRTTTQDTTCSEANQCRKRRPLCFGKRLHIVPA